MPLPHADSAAFYNPQAQDPELSEHSPPQKSQGIPIEQAPLLQTPALHTSLGVQAFPSQLAAPSGL